MGPRAEMDGQSCSGFTEDDGGDKYGHTQLRTSFVERQTDEMMSVVTTKFTKVDMV